MTDCSSSAVIGPVEFDLFMNKGADFNFYFRVIVEGVALDLSDRVVRFTASDMAGGTEVFQLRTDDSPVQITIDAADNYLTTVNIPASQTEIGNSSLYYEIDFLYTDGVVERKLYGQINVFAGA